MQYPVFFKSVCVLILILGMAVGWPPNGAVADTRSIVQTSLYDAAVDATSWSSRRDDARLRAEFQDYRLEQDTDDGRLDWRFTPRNVHFNDIFLEKEIARPFSMIRVRLDNPGPAFSLALKVVDATGSEWTVPPVAVDAGAANQRVDFPHEAWMPAPWAGERDPQLDFPINAIAVIAFDLSLDTAYHIRLAELLVERPEPPVATLTDFDFPDTVHAGEDIAFDLAFQLDAPCLDAAAALLFQHAGGQVTRFPLPINAAALEPNTVHRFDGLAMTIPRFIYDGASSVHLQLGEARVVYEGEDRSDGVKPVHVVGREIGETHAEVRDYRGKPTLFINDEPHNGMAYTAYHPELAVFDDFTAAGVNLYSISATPTESGYGLARTVWVAPDEYDFSQLDERIRLILEANPEAYIFPRLYLHAPRWWSAQHPDDVVQMDPGDGQPVVFQHQGPKPAPSWASATWRRDTVEGLRRLVAHVEAAPYADRIIGYHLASGTTEEWMMWGANEGEWVDYSPVNQARFRDWLRAKYGEVDALRRAWGNPDLDFADVSVPLRQARESAGWGSLRDPETEQQVIDYYLYHSDLVAETINHFARATKEIAGADKTVGIFYGYLLQLSGEQRQQNAGHLALGQVLASPDIDFLCSPTSYAFRELGGEGTSHFMSLTGSVQRYGKLWFNENDIRTSMAPGEVGSWGKAEDIAGDVLQQEKELANVLVNGVAQWWFDVGGNRYDDPELMTRLGAFVDNADTVRDLARQPRDEVALVVDERSLVYLRVGDPIGNELLTGQLPALHRMGAPVGHYLAEDLATLADHRMLILASSLAPDAAQREAVEALKGAGRVLVFLWNSGLYDAAGPSEAAAEDFTGIRMRLTEDARQLRAYADEDAPAALRALAYGPGRMAQPMLIPDDPEARVLARFEDGVPALVLREYEDWTAVYSAVSVLPAALWRYLGAQAGVHSYIETPDVVWASEDLIGISVDESGPRQLHLQRPARLRDLYSGDMLGPVAATQEVDFDALQTRVFVLESTE